MDAEEFAERVATILQDQGDIDCTVVDEDLRSNGYYFDATVGGTEFTVLVRLLGGE